MGLVLNFVVLLLIGYFLTSKLNKVILVPFGLQYLFMLYTPVTGNDFIKRLEKKDNIEFLVNNAGYGADDS